VCAYINVTFFSQCPYQGLGNLLCGYYVCHFIGASNGKKITFPNEDDVSIEVSNWHLVAYLVISFVPFSQCTFNICFLNISSHTRILQMLANFRNRPDKAL
jgi:hypothetical protein